MTEYSKQKLIKIKHKVTGYERTLGESEYESLIDKEDYSKVVKKSSKKSTKNKKKK